jgi:hypothetical protein
MLDGFALAFVGFEKPSSLFCFWGGHWAGAYQRWLRIVWVRPFAKVVKPAMTSMALPKAINHKGHEGTQRVAMHGVLFGRQLLL